VIEFTVPGAPQGKGRAKIVKIGGFSRMATPAKTVAYEGLVAYTAQQAMHQRTLFDGAVSMMARLDCAIPASWSKKKRDQALAGVIRPTTTPDLDNCIKALCDGMNGVVWRDDSQVVSLNVIKRYAMTPCAHVQIEAISQ
jgi:Holliday junction resolvase RusA-like endonuclease